MLFSTSTRLSLLGLLSGLFALTGCSRSDSTGPGLSPAEGNLYAIGKAYLKARERLGRPPRNADELKPSLEGDVSGDWMRSPNDHEEYFIIWDTDFNKLAPDPKDPFTVAAYETRGSGGKRAVLRFPLSVTRMSDEDFRNAVFPPGHGPPN